MATLEDWLVEPGYAFDAPAFEPMCRLRAQRVTDVYGDEADSWDEPDTLDFDGYVSTAASTDVATDGVARVESTDTARLVCARGVDVRKGDRVKRYSDGAEWTVTERPSRDVNPFTGWEPTLTAYLKDWEG